MKFSYTSALILSGIVWVIVGVGLLVKGYNYALQMVNLHDINLINEMSRHQFHVAQRKLLTVAMISTVIGYLKGRFVLSKTVDRFFKRIAKLDEPLSLNQIFTKRYIVLILTMMTLGMGLRFLELPYIVKAVIDFAVGSALIYGGYKYFKTAQLLKRELPEE
ncbi:MAG: hypothetical protein P0S95_01715 [Rhabdochlamydiaceae bacterium]|nr:hypothetical protein [Candidatus Amphrikana amoebophyrae]